VLLGAVAQPTAQTTRNVVMKLMSLVMAIHL